jgi:FMN-dependent NADH-azoreductase
MDGRVKKVGKLLYIKVNPKKDEDSVSATLANDFLTMYQKTKNDVTIEKLDLYNQDIPFLDVDVFSAWGKFASHDDLTEVEQEKVKRMDELTNQFLEADKIVISAPFWNLSYPPMFKAYIDTICIAGKTFKYTETGPVGLLQGKSVLLIESRGGIYSKGPAAELENSLRYLKTIMNFMGIQSFIPVIAEGLDIDENYREKAIQEARAQLKEISYKF